MQKEICKCMSKNLNYISSTVTQMICIENGPFPTSFSLFSSLYYSWWEIKFVNDWIRTADLWYWRRPLYQLRHNHKHFPCRKFVCLWTTGFCRWASPSAPLVHCKIERGVNFVMASSQYRFISQKINKILLAAAAAAACLLASSVTSVAKCCHFGKILQSFEGLFLIWQIIKTTLANLLHYWAKFHCYKWPNIDT